MRCGCRCRLEPRRALVGAGGRGPLLREQHGQPSAGGLPVVLSSSNASRQVRTSPRASALVADRDHRQGDTKPGRAPRRGESGAATLRHLPFAATHCHNLADGAQWCPIGRDVIMAERRSNAAGAARAQRGRPLAAAYRSIADRMDPNRSEQVALALSAAVFSGLAVFVTPRLERTALPLKLVAVLLGAVSLGSVFLFLRRRINGVWARPYLGWWIYSVSLQGDKPDPEYAHALACIRLESDGTLTLTADHYADRDSAVDAHQGGSVESGAHLTSLAESYESRHIRLLYQIKYLRSRERPGEAGETREGQLHIWTPETPNPRILQGEWQSIRIDRSDLKAGTITMWRPHAVPR